MPLRLLEAPALEVVSLEELKGHLRVDFDDDDADLQGFLETAVEDLDGPEGDLQRALAPQRWALDLAEFPGSRHHLAWRTQRMRREQREQEKILIPLPPLISVEQVSYVDEAGATINMVEGDDYVVVVDDGCGSIEPAPEACWPIARDQANAVTIQFTAGYPPDPDDPDRVDIPTRLRTAIKMIAGDLYANREGQVISESRAVALQSETLERFLRRFRVRRG